MKKSASKSAARGTNLCRNCGQVMECLPFPIDNLICKECYGLDRYRHQHITGVEDETKSQSVA